MPATNVVKIIGTRTTYTGTEHPYLRGHEVVIVGVLRLEPDSEEHDYLTDDGAIARAGGIRAADRVEVAPMIGDRQSWVTSDPRAIDLVAFAGLVETA